MYIHVHIYVYIYVHIYLHTYRASHDVYASICMPHSLFLKSCLERERAFARVSHSLSLVKYLVACLTPAVVMPRLREWLSLIGTNITTPTPVCFAVCVAVRAAVCVAACVALCNVVCLCSFTKWGVSIPVCVEGLVALCVAVRVIALSNCPDRRCISSHPPVKFSLLVYSFLSSFFLPDYRALRRIGNLIFFGQLHLHLQNAKIGHTGWLEECRACLRFSFLHFIETDQKQHS